MDIRNILIDDSNGDLASDLFKNHPTEGALSAWFETEGNTRVLKFSINNIRFDSVPNINRATYKTFLTYNGTLGYTKSIYSTVIASDKGIFNTQEAPVLSYDPNTMEDVTDIDELQNTVIDIKMYNGTVDVLRYSEGILTGGEKSYRVKSVRSNPTVISSYPNVEANTVFVDGWYTYTTIIFRQITSGAPVSVGNFYALGEFIFSASDDGYVFITDTGDIFILREGDTLITDGIQQESNEDYKEMLFSLNETTGVSSQSGNIYLHSQILVTEELRDSITKEIVKSAIEDASGCDFADWQKLTLKRLSASIMFQNELYENAQILIESSRAICSAGDYETGR